MARPARRQKLHLRFFASASLVLAMLAGLIGFAQSASAHSLSLVGVASCQEDGTFTITWTLSNDYQLDSIVHSFSVAPNVGTTHLTADGSYHGGTPYNGSGTVVPANSSIHFTTTAIPGTTPSVTLNVAGTWTDNFMQQNPPSATVQLTGDCFGTLKITKHVTGQSAPPANTNYTIAYNNGQGTSGTVVVQAGQTASVSHLPFGTYTLSEVSPAGDKVTISPNPVTVSPDARTATISVTNAFPDDGGFTVTKHVTGETGGYVAGSTFTVAYSCSNGASGSLTLADGDTKGVSTLPIGTTCTLSEGAKPPTKDASYVYGPESWTPSNTLTIVANDHNNTVGVVLTNPITRVLGGFTVTKHVTGETGGYVAGSTFTVSYSCSDGTSGTLTLKDGDTSGVGNLPIGTTYALSETSKPATKDASYVWGTPTWTPSSSVTIVKNDFGNTVGVVLTNPLVRVLGGFTVTKHVTGETGGYVAGSTFTVSYSCSDGTSGTLTLKDGDTSGVSNLPIGTTCTLSETGKPATKDASYVYGAESWTPSNSVTVAKNDSDNTVGVVLTNPIVRVEGGFTVTKHVTGETGGYVGDSTFTVSYSCTNGASGTLTLADGDTKAVSGLPLLTSCTLSETGKPATKDASYAWGPESWTPSNTVTIVANSSNNVVGVVLTNPLVRVVGGFTVTKHVTGETGGYVAGSTFTVSFTCSDGTSGTLMLKDGDTSGASNLPIGTTCSLSETAKPATKDASYAWGSESWDPSNTVTIAVNDSDNTVGVVLTNPLVRVLGGFTVTKQVTGAVAGYVAGSSFTVTYTCSDGTTGSLELTNGETKGVDALPIGTTCTLAETGKPDTSGSTFTWGTPVWTPSNTVTIVANDTQNSVSVTLKNPLTEVLGEQATPPTTTAPGTLPKTGASDTIYLLVIGLMLLIGGGCFVAAARVEVEKK